MFVEHSCFSSPVVIQRTPRHWLVLEGHLW
jgi:hypothetical protein